MKKALVLSSLVALTTVSAANARGLYFGSYLSTGARGDLMDAISLDAAVGYSFGEFRVEADVASIQLYADNDADFVDNLNLNIGVTAVKGLYDFALGDGFAAYVGAGLMSPSGICLGDGHLAANAVGVVGIKYAMTSELTLDLQYNRTLGLISDGDTTTTGGNNIVKLGIVYSF